MTKVEIAKILLDARKDPLRLIETCLFIIDKDARLVRLKLNAHQQRLHDLVVRAIREGKPVRFIVLKARRVGISTYIQALAFTLLLTRAFAKAAVLTHERELSQELAAISATFFEHLDVRLRPEGKAHANRIELERIVCDDGEISLSSTLMVDTSTGKESGRGKTFHFLHLSEFAFYVNPQRTIIAMLPTVARRPGTFVFIESTANGVGNAFHRQWQAAERGEGTFVPVFMAWHEFDEYQLTPPADFKATPDEIEEAARYGLSDAQLYWRRVTIADECGGDEEKFRQEYPGTPDEAFQSSGNPAFSKKILADYRVEAEKLSPPKRGYLEPGEPPRFHESDRGNLLIHTLPRADAEYMLGVDTAQGVEGGDASAGAVLDRNRNRFAATWWGHIDPRRLAHEMALLGHFYNAAIIAPETNNTGLTTLIELTETIFYEAVYRWRRYDNMRSRWTDKLGWQTTVWSRHMLVDDMTTGLREHLLGIPSLQLISELSIFDRGQERVADDDLAMAALIAWHCHLVTPMSDGSLPKALLEDKLRPKAKTEERPLDRVSEREWQRVAENLKRAAGGRGAGAGVVVEVSDVAGGWDDDPSPEIPF